MTTDGGSSGIPELNAHESKDVETVDQTDRGGHVAQDAKLEVYHEKQTKARCALHALNNLYQEPHFTKAQMDEFCHTLSPDTWINPHKSIFGIGHYDINVVSAATATTGHVVKWFDKRKKFEAVRLDLVYGFILNTETTAMLGLWTSHHWFTVRQVNGLWYDLDSTRKVPAVIPDLLKYMTNHLAKPQSHLLIIVSQNHENEIYT